MFKRLLIIAIFICLNIFFFFHPHVHAQQNIINVPSSDVLPEGGLIIKESTKSKMFGDDQFVNITPTLIFGTGKGTNVFVGASTALDGETKVRGAFGAKKVFYIKEAGRFTVGANINPYFSGGKALDSFIYSHYTYRIRKTKTALTAGGYVAGKERYLPGYAGVLFGIEQVLIPNKLRLAFDWMSSENSTGNMGIGLKYRPEPTLSMTTSVNIPNNSDRGISFGLSISKYIALKDLYKRKKGDL